MHDWFKLALIGSMPNDEFDKMRLESMIETNQEKKAD
jgi:hypothetical protein